MSAHVCRKASSFHLLQRIEIIFFFLKEEQSFILLIESRGALLSLSIYAACNAYFMFFFLLQKDFHLLPVYLKHAGAD